MPCVYSICFFFNYCPFCFCTKTVISYIYLSLIVLCYLCFAIMRISIGSPAFAAKQVRPLIFCFIFILDLIYSISTSGANRKTAFYNTNTGPTSYAIYHMQYTIFYCARLRNSHYRYIVNMEIMNKLHTYLLSYDILTNLLIIYIQVLYKCTSDHYISRVT